MAKSGKMRGTGQEKAFDFSLGTKQELSARRKQLVLTHSETLRYQFQRLREKINWDALRQAATEDEVKASLSGVDQFDRERLPNAAAILATVGDPKYPKLRPIPFIAESCGLALQTNPKAADEYSPRYSRDVCYRERKRRGPARKPITNLDYWRAQAEIGQRVPTRFLRRINKEAKQRRNSADYVENNGLTYTDIPERMDSVKKKRTTVWLPETTVTKLKQLSVSTGAPMSELFRRAVETYLKNR